MTARALAGVDGCRAGWIAAVLASDGTPALLVVPRFADLLEGLPPDAVLAVDMPIGLPERIEGAGRAAERAVRPRLGSRRPSLFSIPARAAVEAGAGPFADGHARRAAFAESGRLARASSRPSRGVSIQSFGIFPRIVELDRLLRASPGLSERVVESHPELAFAALNGGVPMAAPKKRGGRADPAGMAERQALLGRCGVPAALLGARLPRGAGEDDRCDACALLLVAERFAAGRALSYPDPPERDAHGLPVAIWA